MQFRTLHITLLSGKNLKKVAPSRNTNVYAVVSISNEIDGSKQKHTTPSDRDGGANPTWNFLMEFKVGEAALQTNRLALEFKLLCKGTPGGDRDVGRLSVPIKELLDSTNNTQFVGRVEHEGELTFSYKFSQKPAAAAVASSSRPPLPSGAEVMESVKKTVLYGAEVANKNVKAVLGSEAVKKNKAAFVDWLSSLPKKKDEGKFPFVKAADLPARARPGPSRQASTSKTEGTSSFYEAFKSTSDFTSSSVSSITQPGSSKDSGKTKPKTPK